jgi:Rod binding domain-containing protein
MSLGLAGLAQVGSVEATGTSSMDARTKAKLADAAQQFEGMMMQELLKPMQAGQDGWGGEDQNDDAASDTVSNMGTEAVADAIAKGGGMGIAKQVIRQVTAEHVERSRK